MQKRRILGLLALVLLARLEISWALPNMDEEDIRPSPELVDHRENEGHEMSEGVYPATFDRSGFGPDPQYPDSEYDTKAQYEIYGGKRFIDKVKPMIEFGQELYTEGPLNQSYDLIGRKNLVSPQFYVSGDWRLVAADNYAGAQHVGQIASRLNLDMDLKLTATERVHMLLRPLDRNGAFTNYQFSGSNDKTVHHFTNDLNIDPSTFFFEGDLGSITAGLQDQYVSYDLPFTFGLIPLVLQNGIWMDDAFNGAAFAIPSLHSSDLLISNMDITFFGAKNKVTTAAIKNGAEFSEGVQILGATTYLETHEGYLEVGYGRVLDQTNRGLSYNNMAVSWTKRYGGWLSNSIRFIYNEGQQPTKGARTANGYVVLVENSLITSLPSTLIPYANLFFGNDHPQSLARDAGAGGILKNTGLSFETDGLTGFPKLDDTANNTYGGALGVEYLFDLNKQIVVEVATVQTNGLASQTAAPGAEYALSARYQENLTPAWIFRTDAILAHRDNATSLAGIRFELRRKF